MRRLHATQVAAQKSVSSDSLPSPFPHGLPHETPQLHTAPGRAGATLVLRSSRESLSLSLPSSSMPLFSWQSYSSHALLPRLLLVLVLLSLYSSQCGCTTTTSRPLTLEMSEDAGAAMAKDPDALMNLASAMKDAPAQPPPPPRDSQQTPSGAVAENAREIQALKDALVEHSKTHALPPPPGCQARCVEALTRRAVNKRLEEIAKERGRAEMATFYEKVRRLKAAQKPPAPDTTDYVSQISAAAWGGQGASATLSEGEKPEDLMAHPVLPGAVASALPEDRGGAVMGVPGHWDASVRVLRTNWKSSESKSESGSESGSTLPLTSRASSKPPEANTTLAVSGAGSRFLGARGAGGMTTHRLSTGQSVASRSSTHGVGTAAASAPVLESAPASGNHVDAEDAWSGGSGGATTGVAAGVGSGVAVGGGDAQPG